MDEERLFKTEELDMPLPPNAHMTPSKPCGQCNEPTMATKLVQHSGRYLCRACAVNEVD
jgi:formylmethanofuran dehydrogenase subunit E